jgi:cathepsin L
LFSKWIAQHNKKYNHENFFYRYTVFKHNMDFITTENKKGHTYTLGMNAFGDLSHEEFVATYASGYRSIKNSVHRQRNTVKLHGPVDPSIDWRAKGDVTAVKNQEQCGSCWAFSATGSMESAVKIASGTAVDLSEQQLVDCSTAQGNQGCNGGLMDQAFQYVVANGGITSEKQYPYVAMNQNCNTAVTSVASITGFTDVAQGDEKALQQAVDKMGPVSVAIEADQQCFQFYSGGVLNDPSCGTQLDHGVLAVGYDTTGDTPFWIVKNSWGAAWGESGYIRMAMWQNQCGISAEPSYPTGAKAVGRK